MKIKISDKLLEKYKGALSCSGYDVPSTDKEWTDEFEEILKNRMDCLE